MRVSQLTLSKKDLELGVLPAIVSRPDVHLETKRPPPFTFPRIGKIFHLTPTRMGRNPATGEAIKIPAKTLVKMRVAKAAKEAIVPGKK